MKKTLLLGTALMIGVVGFAQSGAKKTKQHINPKYLQKTISNPRVTVDSKPTPGKLGTPTNAKLKSNSVQGGTNTCGLEEFTTSWNCFGVGGGATTSSQNCLSYNSDLNTLIWTQRGSKTWALNTSSGFLQSTLINATTLATDSVVMYKAQSNLARYPSGILLNPTGNTDIHNAYAVAIGSALDAGGTVWVGTAYVAKPLWWGNVLDHHAPILHDSLYEDSGTGQIFGNVIAPNSIDAPATDLQFIGNGTAVSVGGLINTDITGTDQSPIRGAVFTKGVINSTTHVVDWSVDTTSIVPPVYWNTATGGLGYLLQEPRMAFGPDGQTGYVVFLGRLQQNYNNPSADSAMSPIVYKTMDGGNTWNLQSNLLGYDWFCHHPEVEQNLNQSIAYEGYVASNYWDFSNYEQGADVTVDKNGVLHYVTFVHEPNNHYGHIDSIGVYSYNFHYDYVNFHPLIWDFMTDGNDWSTLRVDSIMSSSLGSATDDTTASSSPMGGTQILGVDAHLTVSRSLDGSKIFYGWADSDPGVVGTNIYGQALNTNPDIMMKAWDINSNMMTATSKNTTSSNPYTQKCFYPYLSDISYNDGSQWVVPAVFTVGHVIYNGSGSFPIYDASSQADYHYSKCGTFADAEFTAAAMVNMDPNPGSCSDAMGIKKSKNSFETGVTNYPNPFNSTTTIAVTLSEAKSFSVNIYNTIGALVYSKTVSGNVGANAVSFDGSSLNAGVYYYTVNAGNQQTTKKMVIAK